MGKLYKAGLIFTGDSKGATKSIALTKTQLDKLNATQKKSVTHTKTQSAAFSSMAGMLKGLIPVISAVSFARMITGAIDSADEIGKMSTRLGASTEALSEYRYVADLSGVTFKELSTSWQRMTRRVSEAAAGTGAAKDAFAELGLSAEKLSAMKPEEQFEVLSEALRGVANEGDRVRLANKFWDSEGVKMLQIVNQSAEAVAGYRQEARDLGLSLSEHMTKKAEDANDAMTRLGASFGGMAQDLAVNLAGPLTDFVDWIREGISWLRDFAGEIVDFGAMIIKQEWFPYLMAGWDWFSKQMTLLMKQIQMFYSSIFDLARIVASQLQDFGTEIGKIILKIQGLESGDTTVVSHLTKRINEWETALKKANEELKYAKLRQWTQGIDAAQKKVERAEKWIQVYSKRLEDAKEKAGDAADATEELGNAGEKTGDTLKQNLIPQLKGVDTAAEDAEKANKKLAETFGDIVLSLQMEHLALVHTEREMYALELMTKGLAQAQIDAALAIWDSNKALENQQATAAAAGKEIKQAADEMSRAEQVISQSLTDALMRGFEGGLGMAENFTTTLSNMFRSLVLRPTVQFMAAGAAGMITSPFASAAGGGVTGGSVMSGVGSMFGGNSIGIGVSNFMGGSVGPQQPGTVGSYFSGASTIPNWGYGAAGVGGYMGANAMYGDEGYAGAGGSMGAMAGMTIGSMFGPLGMAAGAAIGTIAGGYLGSLIGGGKDNQKIQVRTVEDARGPGDSTIGVRSPFGQVRVGAHNTEGGITPQATEIANAFAQMDKDVASMMTDSQINRASQAAQDFKFRDKVKELDIEARAFERLDAIVAAAGGQLRSAYNRFRDMNLSIEEVLSSTAQYIAELDAEAAARAAAVEALKISKELLVGVAGDYADVFQNYDALVIESSKTLGEAAYTQRLAIVDLAKAYDGSLDKTLALTDAMVVRYKTEIELLAQVDAAYLSVSSTLQGSIESIKMATMTDEERYDYLTDQSEALAATLGDMVDPAKIQATISEINQITMAAWSSLSAEQMAMVSGDFQDFLGGVMDVATNSLDNAKSVLQAEHDVITSAIESAMHSAGIEFTAAASSMQGAAASIKQAAASIPRNINVSVSLPRPAEVGA